MHCLAGLDSVSSGRVFIGDVELTSLKEKRLTQLRRDRIGFVFQSAAALAGCSPERASQQLDALVDAGWAMKSVDNRLRLNPLVHAYAQQLTMLLTGRSTGCPASETAPRDR